MSKERSFVVASELAEALGPHLDYPPPPIFLSLWPYRYFLLNYDTVAGISMTAMLNEKVVLLWINEHTVTVI